MTSRDMAQKKGILERLDDGVVIGDGGYVWALEKRGYVKAGPWTPEAAVENPEAVKQLHREFLRAGSDVLQAFTFYASDDKLVCGGRLSGQRLTCETINTAACKIAREVANEGDSLVAGGLTHTPSYLEGKGKEFVQAEYRKQVKAFVDNGVDFVICEYYEYIEELEWAIQVALESGKTVASSMCIGPDGDSSGVSVAECAVRMVDAGAKIVGVNCRFGPETCVQTMKLMKAGLEAAGKLDSVHLMVQALVFHTPDVGQRGYVDLPEFPFALEPRTATRWDIQKYARQAFDIGVRYIGGCCGFEPYHIRAIAEELSAERGKLPAGSEKHGPWGAELRKHTKPWVRARASREYWENLKPASGRPYCPSFSKPDH